MRVVSGGIANNSGGMKRADLRVKNYQNTRNYERRAELK
jgi:hypothetical protein